MAGESFDDDSYVANLLKQDAKSAAKKYELVGIDAFNPKRNRSGAPKPNTNFLRHIIRQTDSHNAALLAKEAEDSRARLKEMNRGKAKEQRRQRARENRGAGRLTPPDISHYDERDRKRRRDDYSDTEDEHDRWRRRNHYGEPRDSKSREERDSERPRRREMRRSESSDENARSRRKSRRSRHHRDRERRHIYSSDEREHIHRKEHSSRRHRHRSYSRSRSPLRSPSPRSSRHPKPSSHRHKSRSSRQLGGDEHAANASEGMNRAKTRSSSPATDSDPLEAIVGPIPPPSVPVRSRGRGAHKAHSMGMDSRFSSTYDPSVDVQINSDVEDDWGDALEALKDRQRWQQQGAERLRAAGFTDDQVKKWEKGDEKDEEDVVWRSKGQAREWDIGKVVDEDGDIDVKAEWGRLK